MLVDVCMNQGNVANVAGTIILSPPALQLSSINVYEKVKFEYYLFACRSVVAELEGALVAAAGAALAEDAGTGTRDRQNE